MSGVMTGCDKNSVNPSTTVTVNNRPGKELVGARQKSGGGIFRPVITIIQLEVIWMRVGTRAARAPYATDFIAAILNRA